MVSLFRSIRAAATAAAILVCSGCHQQQSPSPPAQPTAAPPKASASSPPTASASIADAASAKPVDQVWFTCKATDSAVDFVATEPAVGHAFTLQERERATGKVIHEYALTEGEGDAGAGHVFTTFLQGGKEFGTLSSVNGEMLDPPVKGTVPSELRMGDRNVSCQSPGADMSPPKLSATAIQGTWSFDGSCASGDGMILRPDGAASLDEGGEGRWAIAGDNRLSISLQQREPGDDNAKPEQVEYSLEVTQLVAERLVGTLTDTQGSRPVRAIDARRCANKT